MTPPAAAAAPARTRTRRPATPPRRVSGPVRQRAGATTTAPPRLALRVGGAVHGLAEHRLVDRLVRGRAWIAILGFGLIGIVFMQVSMLRMNAGIGSAVDTAARLERENSSLRASISELSSGDHVQAQALRMGFVVPTLTPRFLDAHGVLSSRAAAAITAPGDIAVPATTLDAAQAGPSLAAPATTTTPGTTTTSTTTTTGTPAATTPPTAATTVAPAPATTTPAPVTAAPVTATPVQQTAQPAAAAAPAATGGVAPVGQGR